jgi:hypothetical protein
MAPPVPDPPVDELDPHRSAAVTLGPEITVFAGMTLPPGQVTATPVLHGPTAVAVGVLCALTKLATPVESKAAIINVRFRMPGLAASCVDMGIRRLLPGKIQTSQN